MVVADIKVSPFKDHFWHFQIKIKFGKKIRKNGIVRLPDDVFFWIIPLSSFNLKGFYYSYAWSCSLCEGKTSFCTRLIFRKLCGVLLMFSTCFTSLSVLLFFSLLITFLEVLLFWIYLFLLMLVFVLHWLFLHWEILIMLSQFPSTCS